MELKIERRSVDHLIPYVRNARTHSEDQVAQIAASIAEFGFVNPILIGSDDVIVAGHGRLLAARRLGLAEVPVIVLDHLSEAQHRALVIADNKLAENAGWDETMLRAELAALHDEDFDLDLLGFAEAELGRLLDAMDAEAPASAEASTEQTEAKSSTLAEGFGIPPFSVLDARKGWWQDRKRAWIDLGIRSELGRGATPGGNPRPLDRAKMGQLAPMSRPNAAPGGSPLPATDYSRSKARGDGRGRALS
jgi:ParB-like chromosome segregation protein Spo0J